MKSNRLTLLTVFLVAVLVLVGTASSVMAQVPWIDRSQFTFEVWNNTGVDAHGFHLVIRGIHEWDVDNVNFYSSAYGAPELYEDQSGVHLDWRFGTTPAGQSSAFGFNINHAVSFQGVDMYWSASGAITGHIDAAWQDWNVSPVGVSAVISSQSGAERYVRRLAGYQSDPIGLSELASMGIPPNPTLLDPLPPMAPTTVSPGAPLSYNYAPFTGRRQFFMLYDVYADSFGAAASTPIVRFRNAASVPPPSGGLTLSPNGSVPDRFLYPGDGVGPYYEMISVLATADPYEDLSLKSISLGSWGSGIDSTGNSSVRIWKDVNDDGKVDPAVDQLLGSCVYPSNIVQQTIEFSSPIVIPAGGGLSLVVSYTAPPSATPGSTFELNLGYVDAEGLTSGVRVPVISDEIRSARLIVGVPPISIAEAKRLPIDQSTGTTDVVLLKDVVVTADLQPSMGLVYGEDQLRTAGIGALLGPDDQNDGEVIPEGARVDLLGRVRLLDGAELVLEIIEGAMLNVDEPLAPIAMNNKSTGGGVFGSQPAVLDNAPAMIPAAGLNNVGMLVRTWGYVRGMGQLTIDGKLSDVVWIDDGSGLQDGAMDLSGIAVMKPADWQGDAPTGLLAVTGIIRAVPNGDGKPVRLLVPRSQSDTTSFPAST